MKIIVCGAGNLGRSVVSYLVKGNNDIVVIDDNTRDLDEMSKEFDILPVQGKPSHPDILEKAGAKNCDMILAVTDIDEVNMMVCQLAYSLFEIPKKIASVNSKTFIDPLWGMLYNDNHLPIDLLISPDIDIAANILKILQYPGCAGILPVLDEAYYIVTLNLKENCPLLNIPLAQIGRQDDLDIGFINIIRNDVSFLPDMYEVLKSNDEINILVKAIEEDIDKARWMARNLNHVVVIHGEMMSDVILQEADIQHADAVIALTDNDKDNLLASLLASKSGVGTTISVINTPSYNNLMFNITDNILVDRSAITISRVLKEIRKAKIREAYSVSREMGEIWEMRLEDENICRDKKVGELNLPKTCRVFALRRGEELIYPDPTTKLECGDLLLVYVDSAAVKQAEEIFC